MPDPRDTPAMRQYLAFKKAYPDCVLLFRMGDFYELFFEDAVTASRAVGLTLTQRTEGVPMAGVPYHQLDTYLRRLKDAGLRIAVADQLQDPKQAKGLVERGVTRLVTPGTLIDEPLQEGETPARLAAVLFTGAGDDSPAAAAIVDASTGEFLLTDGPAGDIADELARRDVREVLFADPGDGRPPERVRRMLSIANASATLRPAWQFRRDESLQALREQFGVSTLAGFGLRDDDPALPAAGAVVRYLRHTQCVDEPAPDAASARPAEPARPRPTLAHLAPPRRESSSDHLVLDATTLRALEVTQTLRQGERDASLVGLFTGPARSGGCRTAAGRRLVREWLCRPPATREPIERRQRAVATLVEDRRTAAALGEALEGVQDVARIGGRIALGRATPRDVVALGRSLEALPALGALLVGAPAFADHLGVLGALERELSPFASDIRARCVDAPPAHLREGGLFRDAIDAELDECRLLQRDAASWLAAYQQRLGAALNLPGVRVGYTKVFGYYIELTSAQARSAPPELIRTQTLKNAERYTTPELKDFERKVTTAEARGVERERVMFSELCAGLSGVLPALRRFAQAVAELDVLLAFAERASRRAWTRPIIADAPALDLTGGRHPVLEDTLGPGFVPNDAALGLEPDATPSGAGPRLALITGPNMAGKSTFIRQVALITLLAHAGSFVPADGAVVGLCDRIFTRVGADDALHAGQSTFMVEMTETANILHHATPRSLVILDEIGRGTSTLDGLSLAWAIAEHLAHAGPRTLFATHYHELTELEERLEGRVRNLHVAVRDWNDEIVFLHRILPGRTDRSYGIHVAKLAGLPTDVIARAREVLDALAVHHAGSTSGANVPARPAPGAQLTLFTEYLPHPAVDALREIKLDALTPLAAFDALRRLRDLAERPTPAEPRP